MPTITLNRKVVDKIIGEKIPEEKLKDKIAMMGTDLEEIDDKEITVEIFPNRPDMLSEQGFGRALSSFLGINTGLKEFNIKKPEDIVFRPLEWKEELNAKQILEKHPAGKKYKDLVKDLRKYAIFHDANDNILSFTPVINSHLTGKITKNTKEAFLEVSGFDFHTAEYVLNIIVTALYDMGADIYSMEVKYPDKTIITPNLTPTEMKINIDYINKWLGLDLKKEDLKKYLGMMGFGYKKDKVLIPAYRPDIIHQVDVAEDIAVAYGYENFNPEIPTKATTAKEHDFEKFKRKVADLMVGLNMLELSTYHLTNEDIQFKKMEFNHDNCVELINSVSEEYNIMRFWMLPSLIEVLSQNTHNEYPQNIFEIGRVFLLDNNKETGVKEVERLSVALCNNDADYTKIRQVLDYLVKNINLNYKIKETEHPSFIPGRVARVSVKGKEVAYVGEINPKVLENFDIEMPVAAFELNLSELFELL